ncbi:nucleoside/nucleotide kinase family protein [Pseudokineococcus sp. 1T1Z-3]|uniref:nucleoside/nucleotide kinase family protein n=1 Tax=Pseudokineococcus sp. 1T1Z-3 TaxID=3132745 RepID=UPI0030A0C12C
MTSSAELLARARALAEAPGRAVLGIAGAPGAGKTTLAEWLVAELAADPPPGQTASWVAHVPMDGFHLADVALRRLGRLERKGAPDTFDAAGFAALLGRLRSELSATVYAPAFERHLEQPLAGALAVAPECRLVVSEGNYLLLDDPAWAGVRALLDEVWFVTVDDDLRRDRLVARHVQFGKAATDAVAWVAATDEPNARLVAPGAAGADVVVPSSVVPAPR